MIKTIFDALRAVSGPATLIAYVLALAAWAYVAPALARLRAAGRDLALMPEQDRRSALEVLYGPIPAHITAEEWIRDRRMRLLLVGFLSLLLAVLLSLIWLTKR